MLFRHVTIEDLGRALVVVNGEFKNNIRMVVKKVKGSTPRAPYENWSVRLKVVRTTVPKLEVAHRCGDHRAYQRTVWVTAPGVGLRRGFGSDHWHRIAFPCWHVWGTFMDALPQRVEIVTRSGVHHPNDPWEDYQIGYELMASKACNCEVDPRAGSSGDCIPIRAQGLAACFWCEYRGTNDCGGAGTLQGLLGPNGDKARR